MSYIDVTETGANPNGVNLKASKHYSFKPSLSLIYVNDIDFERVISIFNEDADELIYNLGSTSLTGDAFNNEVIVDFDTSNMAEGDKLYIIYESSTNNQTESLLAKLIDLQKETNKYLKKLIN